MLTATRPGERLLQIRIARLRDRFFQRRIAELRFPRHPVDQPFGRGDVDAAGLHFRPAPQPIELLDERRKAIRPAALRIQIDELGRLARILAHALQLVVIDEVRNEALLVLQLHRVEDAAVRIDADQKIVLRRDREHGAAVIFLDRRAD